jgi:hypothetical protein
MAKCSQGYEVSGDAVIGYGMRDVFQLEGQSHEMIIKVCQV